MKKFVTFRLIQTFALSTNMFTKMGTLSDNRTIIISLGAINTWKIILHAGMALDLLQRDPMLAIARNGNGETALHVLARKPSAFACENQLGISETFVGSS